MSAVCTNEQHFIRYSLTMGPVVFLFFSYGKGAMTLGEFNLQSVLVSCKYPFHSFHCAAISQLCLFKLGCWSPRLELLTMVHLQEILQQIIRKLHSVIKPVYNNLCVGAQSQLCNSKHIGKCNNIEHGKPCKAY